MYFWVLFLLYPMLKKIATLFVLIAISTYLKSQTISQNQDSSSQSSNNIVVKKDIRINTIIETHKKSFKEEGYRIQIFSDNKKQPARDAKSKYLSLRHDSKAHEVYHQPYFKVRVGDFRTKLEALKFQKELTSHFPNCFIVKDEIDIEQLIEQ
jgi:maltose-binding protein MalE